jgi:homoserine kinase
MALYLTIDAVAAEDFGIKATGRNADLCGDAPHSLIFTTYRSVLAANGKPVTPLHLDLDNEIPLGMGCGSSAAALLAGVLLADHFGGLGWSGQQILEEACRREGHPDNVAACYLGGMTASSSVEDRVVTATCGQSLKWNLYIALPSASLATAKARALLPATYSRADAVCNLQNVALLVSAFALDRGDLLRTAMRDRIHQPYRMEACPLLPRLLPLAETTPGVLGVALSGAGPSVLIIAEESAAATLPEIIRQAAADPDLEIIRTSIAAGVVRR